MKTSTSRGRFHDGTKPSLRERLWRQGSILLVLLAPLLLLKPPALFAQVQSLVASNTAFALNLYQQLATNQGNLFLSPYSISTCLAMTYDGARGQTEAQMSHVLGFDTNQSQFASDFGQLQIELEASQQTNAIELNIANALWTQTGFPFLPAFLQNASNHFQANINQADFATQGDAARTAINDWIAQETQNKITNMLEPGTINGATRLVLANAIYFLGVWTEAFAISNTTTQPFYLSCNSQVQVPLMHQLTVERTGWGISFNYMETANYQALELPYGSNQVSMLILSATANRGLEATRATTFSRLSFLRSRADETDGRRGLFAAIHAGLHLSSPVHPLEHGDARCLPPRSGGLFRHGQQL